MNIDIDDYDKQHAAYIEALTKRLESIYQAIIRQAVKYGLSVNFDATQGDIFDFDKFPKLKKRMEELMADMQAQILALVVNGITSEWNLSGEKNDYLVEQVLKSSGLTEEQIADYQNRNLEALAAFQQRKVNGLGLSDRVWNLTDRFKTELELALDVGIGEGRSAQQISRDVRGYLNQPDKLFRRVRDKHGNLKLSKAAAAYHPGQGVYRSSYKNALRMARTEVNMAYHAADYESWIDNPLVIGIEVILSNNHTCNGKPFVDICDYLKGKYPKAFKFTGWHPQCRCVAIPVTPSKKEVIEYAKAQAAGKDVSGWKFKGEVKDMPKAFTGWMKDNRERVERMKSKPYFIIDNEKLVYPEQKQVKDIYEKVVETENEIRMNKKFETAVVFDTDGNIVVDKRGQEYQVRFTKEECALMKDSIITHNHPRGWAAPENSMARIGNSFSSDDIYLAVGNDAAEMRAVTPNFTFSMKRPDDGWNITIEELAKIVKAENQKLTNEFQRRIWSDTTTPAKANIMHYHTLWKRIAAKLGWSYSKEKTR